MEEDLAKLGESMSEEAPDTGKNASEYDKEMAKITGGKSEKEHYESLKTNEEKIEFARQKAELQRKEADRKRDEQVERMNGLSVSNQKELLKNDKEVRDAFYAYNRNQLYDYIDEMKTGAEALSDEEAQFLETSTQAILDNMDA